MGCGCNKKKAEIKALEEKKQQLKDNLLKRRKIFMR